MKTKISIILPFYNESESLNELFITINKNIQELSEYDFDFIFVDDGSIDNSLEIVNKITQFNIKYKIEKDTNIEGDINIISNNKYNFSVDTKIGLKTYKDNDENTINTYKDGLEYSYASSYINLNIISNKTNLYEFDRNYNKYYLDFITSVQINNVTTTFNQKIIGNKILLELNNTTNGNDVLKINFSIKSRVFIYTPDSFDKYYIETDFIELNGEDKSDYIIILNDSLASLRSVWLNNNDRYTAYGFYNDGMIKINSWSGYNTNKLNVIFDRIIKNNEKILIPIVYSKNINSLKDNIYFNYK